MKIVDLKSRMVTPDFNVLYSYCMDGAILFEFDDYLIQVWPEIMCFTVQRSGNRLPIRRYNGRFDKWEYETKTLEFEVSEPQYLRSSFELTSVKDELPGLENRLYYIIGYLNIKDFTYEKRYNDPFGGK